MKFGALSPTSRLANTEEEVINRNTKRNSGLNNQIVACENNTLFKKTAILVR